MAALPLQLAQVCLLRRGPQDLPYSPKLAAGAVLALAALQVLVGSQGDSPASLVAVRAGLTLAMLGLVTPRLLAWRGLGNRTAQTMLAQAGCGLLFVTAMAPLALLLQSAPDIENPPGHVVAAGLLALVLFVGKLRVDAHVWRHALDIGRLQAMALAIALVVVEMLVLATFNPGRAAAAT